MPIHAGAARRLPRGDERFWLGMNRAQLDSAITAHGDTVISNGTAFVVCAVDEPRVQYVQYSFFRTPHDVDFLWRVTVGYRLDASSADFAAARDRLVRILGDPQVEALPTDAPSTFNTRREDSAQSATWSDDEIVVHLGARWTSSPDPGADRMLVTWVDRRLERLMDARRKKESAPKK